MRSKIVFIYMYNKVILSFLFVYDYKDVKLLHVFKDRTQHKFEKNTRAIPVAEESVILYFNVW